MRSVLAVWCLALAWTMAPMVWGADAPTPESLADQGRTLLQTYRKDPSHPDLLVQAQHTFTAAADAFTAIGKKDEAIEATTNVAWCQRQLSRPEVQAAIVAAQHPVNPTPAPQAAPAQADEAPEIPPTVFMRSEPPPAKPVPLADEATCKPVLDQLRTKFAKEYGKRGTEDRREFAIRLFQEAPKNRKDPTSFQVILQESVRLSLESGDVVQTLLSINRMSGYFSGCEARALMKEWLQKSSARSMATTFVTLLDKPTDAVANLAAGRYTAIELGRWEEALPMLARGTPSPLVLLAARDLAAPDEAMDQVAMGEDWYQLSRRGGTSTPERTAWLQRAQHWLTAAKPDLDGLALDRVNQRLADIDKQVPLDLDRLEWTALTPSQWDKLPGAELAIPIRVARSGPAVQLKEGQRARIVAHPSDQWKIQAGSAPITTTWSGLAPKRQANGKAVPGPRAPYRAFRVGELLMQVGTGGDPARLGVIEGPGAVWLLPNRPEGDNEGKIRVKVVLLDD